MVKYNYKSLFFILPALVFVGGFLFWHYHQIVPSTASFSGQTVVVGKKVFTVDIAADFDHWRQGLSDRPSLKEGSGMLFVFPDKQVRWFWMKNMHFPLDIIWIKDDQVVHISRNLPPEGEKPKNTYSSLLPVNYVLEINAGEGSKIKVGDTVNYYNLNID